MDRQLEQTAEFATSVEKLIQTIISENTESIMGCVPCTVVTVYDDLVELQVDVQPLIQKLNRDGSSYDEPVIYSVPIIFPSTSTSAVTMKVSVGDPVLCIFSKYNTDSFKASDGTITTPTDYRDFDLRDCFAIPCVWPFSKSINNPVKRNLPHSTNDLVIAHNIGTQNEIEIRFDDSGIRINAPYNEVSVDCLSAKVEAATTVDVVAETVSIASTNATIQSSSFNVQSDTTTIQSGSIAVIGSFSVNGKPYGIFDLPVVQLTSPVISLTGEFVVNGESYSTFKSGHTHGYTDNGSPSVTTPPITT